MSVGTVLEVHTIDNATFPNLYACDGGEMSREEFPELFATIGIYYGKGDGKTTFNRPKL